MYNNTDKRGEHYTKWNKTHKTCKIHTGWLCLREIISSIQTYWIKLQMVATKTEGKGRRDSVGIWLQIWKSTEICCATMCLWLKILNSVLKNNFLEQISQWVYKLRRHKFKPTELYFCLSMRTFSKFFFFLFSLYHHHFLAKYLLSTLIMIKQWDGSKIQIKTQRDNHRLCLHCTCLLMIGKEE